MTTRLATLLDDIEVAEVVGGDPRQVVVSSVTQDSAAVGPGSLYCCIVGTKVDGHDLAAAVVRSGAGSLLVERVVDVAVTQVRVPSTRRAVAPVAAAFWGRPSSQLTVVGVTGTNGKTTTTHLLAAVLERAGRPTGVLGTLSGERTTPEAPIVQAQLAAFRDEGRQAVAMEVSSIALDQHRVDAIDFRVGVWTNLSQDHLDYHGDAESYYQAKARLFDPRRCAAAVVNVDDAAGRRLARELHIPVTPYGLADAEALRMGPGGSSFQWRGEAVALPLGGAHNVSNALAAATTAELLGVDRATIAAGLSAAPAVPGRWELIDEGQPFTVVVDYAHTPDGLEQVLSAARAAAGAGSRVTVVFGCGGDRDRTKRPLMAAAAARLADLAVLTSDNPRSEDPRAIIAEALAGAAGADNVVVEEDRAQAIDLALRGAAAGDVVVIAGKGHETGQTIGGQTLPFDDRAVARRLLGEAARPW